MRKTTSVLEAGTLAGASIRRELKLSEDAACSGPDVHTITHASGTGPQTPAPGTACTPS